MLLYKSTAMVAVRPSVTKQVVIGRNSTIMCRQIANFLSFSCTSMCHVGIAVPITAGFCSFFAQKYTAGAGGTAVVYSTRAPRVKAAHSAHQFFKCYAQFTALTHRVCITYTVRAHFNSACACIVHYKCTPQCTENVKSIL